MLKQLFKVVILCLFVVFTFACKTDKEVKKVDDINKQSVAFEMYESSPMAALMKKMHAKGLYLKVAIEQGEEDFGPWPQEHIEILTASLTDPTDRDMFFNVQAEEYLRLEKAFYESKGNKKEQFNDLVTSCLACHKQKCGGPISKIEKLIIE